MTDDYLNMHLMENLHDDPYGTATYVIRKVLEDALDDGLSGVMSEAEYANLTALAKLFVEGHGPRNFAEGCLMNILDHAEAIGNLLVKEYGVAFPDEATRGIPRDKR
jgi:heme oxygenase